MLSTGVPQGCVLSLLLVTLLTQNFTSAHERNLIKFADGTTVVVFVHGNDEFMHSAELEIASRLVQKQQSGMIFT